MQPHQTNCQSSYQYLKTTHLKGFKILKQECWHMHLEDPLSW